MKVYDLGIRTKEIEETLEIAEKLGFTGIGFVIPYNKNFEKMQRDIENRSKKTSLDVIVGIEVTGKPNKIKRVVKRIRKKVLLIIGKGGNPEINRVILEIPEIDILTFSYKSCKPGINHILSRLAYQNNVAIEFRLEPLVHSSGTTRIKILSVLLEDARFVNKYHAPFLLSSGALSPWDLRSFSELRAFGKFLGFSDDMIKESFSGKIIDENRKRLSKKWIRPGVEIE